MSAENDKAATQLCDEMERLVVNAFTSPLIRTAEFHPGQRVIANGSPGSAHASVRAGGPGRVISDPVRDDSPFVWVRLDEDAREFPYLPCEIKPEPSV